jgi:hypothetical protein
VSDLARLQAAWANGTLLHPAQGANLVDLSLAIAHAAGGDVTLSVHASSLATTIGRHDHVVFVMVDGLGMHLIDRLPDRAFFRRRLVGELRSVYPSSTAPALTTLATGAWPGRHAVTGWWQHLPEAGLTATILPFVERFSERPLPQTLASTALPAPPMLARSTRDVHAFAPEDIAGSVYSRYSNGGHPTTGYRSLRAAVERIDSRVRRAVTPTYTYVYVPFVDAAQHEHGAHSPPAMASLRAVQREIGALAERLEGRARLVVTADHGLTSVSRRDTWDRNDPLVSMLAFAPSGEPRAPYFHIRDGQQERFSETFRARHGDAWALIDTNETEAALVFGGPLADNVRERIGDFTGVALRDAAILYEPPVKLATMQGFHGGMLPDEMRVPLIVA